MPKIQELLDNNDLPIYPLTHEDGVIDSDGVRVKDKYSTIGHKHNVSDIDGLSCGSGNNVEIVDNLTSTDTNKALAANQGKVLDNKINTLTSDLDTRLDGKSFKYLTKEEYDTILEKDPNIVYCITDEEEVTKEYVDNKIAEAQLSGSGGYKLLTEYIYNENKVADVQSLDMKTGIFTTSTALQFDGTTPATFRAKDVGGSLKGIPYELKDVTKNYSIVKLTSNTFRVSVEGTLIESYNESRVENLDLNSFYIEYNNKEVILDNINCNNVLIEITGTRNRAGWTAFSIVTSNKTIETDSVFLALDGKQWGFITASLQIRNFKGVKDYCCSIIANGRQAILNNNRDMYDQNSRLPNGVEKCFNSESISTVKSFKIPKVFANETSVRIYDLGGE